MSKFLAWLLGMDTTPESLAGGRWSLELQSVPEGFWAVLGLVATLVAVAGIWWLYRIEGRSLGMRRRLVLATLRGLVLAGVVLMLLEAVLVVTQQELVDSHLAVLVDNSESMSLTDPYSNDDLARQTARSVEVVTSDGQPDATAAENAAVSNWLRVRSPNLPSRWPMAMWCRCTVSLRRPRAARPRASQQRWPRRSSPPAA